MVAILEVVNKYVAYLRTSTRKQLLGLDAQKEIINKFINERPGSKIIKSFTEQESGFKDDRKQLVLAINFANENNARLLISTMDRLTRKASFYLQLQEQGVKFTMCDMPEADETVIGIMAILAQKELKNIRKRTRNGLQQIKNKIQKQGRYRTKVSGRFITKLGNTTNIKEAQLLGGKKSKDNAKKYAAEIMPIINEIINVGKVISLYGIAAALNARGIKTSKKKIWWPTTVKNVMERSL
jgi:DNA invertase Pin-like site-specific DNA recombinase